MIMIALITTNVIHLATISILWYLYIYKPKRLILPPSAPPMLRKMLSMYIPYTTIQIWNLKAGESFEWLDKAAGIAKVKSLTPLRSGDIILNKTNKILIKLLVRDISSDGIAILQLLGVSKYEQ